MFILLHHLVFANSDIGQLEKRLSNIFPQDLSQQHISLCQVTKSSCLEFTMWQEDSNEKGRQLIEIQSPEKWKGVRLLHIDYPESEDPFWLYLPALKKVKQITGKRTPLGLDISKLEIHLTGEERVKWDSQQHCSLQRVSKESQVEELELFFDDKQLTKIISSLGFEGHFKEYKNIGSYFIPHYIQFYENQSLQFEIRIHSFSLLVKEEEPAYLNMETFKKLGLK